jgi:hypothetical protein
MSLLLALPSVAIILFLARGVQASIRQGWLMAQLQVVIAFPFLPTNAMGYLSRAFEFSRQFLFKWTVNWRFAGEDAFLSKEFSISLRKTDNGPGSQHAEMGGATGTYATGHLVSSDTGICPNDCLDGEYYWHAVRAVAALSILCLSSMGDTVPPLAKWDAPNIPVWFMGSTRMGLEYISKH